MMYKYIDNLKNIMHVYFHYVLKSVPIYIKKERIKTPKGKSTSVYEQLKSKVTYFS